MYILSLIHHLVQQLIPTSIQELQDQINKNNELNMKYKEDLNTIYETIKDVKKELETMKEESVKLEYHRNNLVKLMNEKNPEGIFVMIVVHNDQRSKIQRKSCQYIDVCLLLSIETNGGNSRIDSEEC